MLIRSRSIVLIFVVISLLVACNNGDDPEVSNNNFVSSIVHEDFPIPKQSILVDEKIYSDNFKAQATYEVEVEVEGYDAKSYVEKGIPQEYYLVIEQSGWKELKDQGIGNLRVFEKDGNIIWFSIDTGNKLSLTLLK